MNRTFTQMFLEGAYRIADYSAEYGAAHQSAGFSREQWELLTDPLFWSVDQQRQVNSLLAEAVSIGMRISGLQPMNCPVLLLRR